MIDTELENAFGQAIQALQAGEWAQAEQTLQRITQSWPDCKEAWYQLGELCQRQGRLTQAVDLYARVLELDAGIQEVYFNLGLIAAEQQQDSLALNYWRRALDLDPAYHSARLQLALLLARSGQSDEALTQLRDVLQRAPQLAEFLFEQAQALRRHGQLPEASLLCQALRQGSDFATRQVILLEIQVLHDLGLDAEASALMLALPEPWTSLIQQLYVPSHYLSQEAFQAAQARLDQVLASAVNVQIAFAELADLPRLRGWELLERQTAIDTWLSQAYTLPQVVLPPRHNRSRQRLVWLIDASTLPWLEACWKHLAALPKKSWEILLLLQQETLRPLLGSPPVPALAGISVLPANPDQARQLILRLQADLLLYASPATDSLQFWLSRQRLAPLQLAWTGQEQVFSELGTGAIDGQAPLYLSGAVPLKSDAPEALLYMLPAQGWHPADLVALSSLKQPLLLGATAAELGALRQLLQALGKQQVRPVIWHSLPELYALYQQANALLLATHGSARFAAAAADCGLPAIALGNSEGLAVVQSRRGQLAPDRDLLPWTSWAVELQHRLNQIRRSA